jgi:polysaccharide biosynthesis transport protein
MPVMEPARGNAANQSADPAQASLLAPIQSQLRSNQLEITNREHSVAALKAKVDDYQGRLNQEPIREQQLADLTRGYEQSQANYDDLLKKTNESKDGHQHGTVAAGRTLPHRRSAQPAH